MREILFRARRLDNGKWIYGALLQCVDGKQYIMEVITGEVVYNEIDPETVGQYTGLKDKNGNKIFEGDIVKFVRYGVVTWHEVLGGFVLFFRPQNPFGSSLHWMLFDIGICPYEVIGNIHDNSALLGDE